MEQRPRNPLHRLVPTLALAGVALAAWAAWLGWDQHRDVHPDGSTTGPYEAWQVLGLTATLLAPVIWAASRGHVPGAVIGTTTGLTIAAWTDWSDDSSGLFAVGVAMLTVGSLAATTTVSAITSALVRARRGGGPGSGPGLGRAGGLSAGGGS
ncbi:hypothetical protein ACIRF8_27750 [Streptomyces sp. NPDC102406]|uniref:hypothetical protein n=1 Tax=Streptomyces sp. NPDC102406 TaxID=3366171 RepID=UPI003807E313